MRSRACFGAIARNLSAGLPPKLIQVATWVCLGVAAACWATYSGPYRWLAEWEMNAFGAYYAFYTWLALSFLLLIPVLGALQISRKLGMIPSAGHASGSADRFRATFEHYRVPFVVLVLGGSFVFLGGRDWLRAQGGKQLERLTVSALERGVKPTSTWLELHDGSVDWESSIEWSEDRAKLTYAPLFSPTWQDGQPVGAILKLNRDELPRAQGDVHVFQGASDVLGLPGAVNAAFEDMDLNAAKTLVLHVGQVPAEDEATGRLFALIGLCIVALGAGLAIRKWRQAASP